MRRVLVLLAVLLLATGLLLPDRASAQFATEFYENEYLNIGVGGLVPVSNYGGIGSRLQFYSEWGGRYFALPISFSRKNNVKIASFKPRYQFIFAPFRNWPEILVAPGVGIVMNYWRYPEQTLGGSANVQTVEAGFEVSGFVRYMVTSYLNITLTPAAFDVNFWRHVWTDVDAGSSTSKSDVGLEMFYNVMLSFGACW